MKKELIFCVIIAITSNHATEQPTKGEKILKRKERLYKIAGLLLNEENTTFSREINGEKPKTPFLKGQDLAISAGKGDIDGMLNALEEGASLEGIRSPISPDMKLIDPLTNAIRNLEVGAVGVLLHLKATPDPIVFVSRDKRFTEKISPLQIPYRASIRNNQDAVKAYIILQLLLESGADISLLQPLSPTEEIRVPQKIKDLIEKYKAIKAISL